MWTRSTLRWELCPCKNADLVHSVFRALLKIEIDIKIEIRNKFSFLGLYSSLRSRLRLRSTPEIEIKIEIEIELRNASSFLGLYSRSISRSHQSMDEARSAPVRPCKKNCMGRGQWEGRRVDQWETGIWPCDRRTNERPRKKTHEMGTDKQTDGHVDSLTNSAQRAELVKNII